MSKLIPSALHAVVAVAATTPLFLTAAPVVTSAAQDGESTTQLSPDSDGGGNSMKLACGPDRVLIGITGAVVCRPSRPVVE